MRELVQKSFKAILALVDAGLSGAASRLVSLSKSDVCLFVFFWFHDLSRRRALFMPSLCAQAFLRFETISHSTQLKKSLDIFCPRLERKQSKEYLVILLVVNEKL